MSIGRSSRFLKIFIVSFVAAFLLIATTRQRISQTAQIDDFDRQNIFLDQIKGKLLTGKNLDADIYDSNEPKLEQSKNEEGGEAVIQQQNKLGSEGGNVDDQADDDIPLPFDDSMPGAYLKFMKPAPTNRSYCKYNYQFPYDLAFTSKDYVFPPQLGSESPYRIIYNVTEAHGIENATQVTYATHMTANFAYFIPQLLRQWEGLVTVAAFVPDLDCAFFLEQINQFCYCEPEMHRVSIHIVTHKLLSFSKKDIYFDRPENCVPQDSSKVTIYKEYDDTVIYPVNVVRNAARTSALTKYVIISDIELMPSKGLASGFLEMVKKYNKTNSKEVFVVPIFEVEETESIPENKAELLDLLNANKSVYFHGRICEHCQKFPEMELWMQSGYSVRVKPLVTVKRHTPYHRWEPIFIGTNEEPLYSEQLSWEGFQDKMTQSLEMCLQNYDYTIMDNAFLCHWPGIRTHKISTEEWRADFVAQNKIVFKEIIQDFMKRYTIIDGCNANFTAVRLVLKDHITKSVELKKPATP